MSEWTPVNCENCREPITKEQYQDNETALTKDSNLIHKDCCDHPDMEYVAIVHVDYGSAVIDLAFTKLGESEKRNEITKRIDGMYYGRLFQCSTCGFIEDYDGNEVKPKT